MKFNKHKNKNLEKYLTGSVLAFVWQAIFVKLVLGIEWYSTLIVAVMTAIIFFIVGVLMLETSELKGNL